MAELTVKASMPMIEGGMLALNREPDLQLAEAAMPSNIELMEGMIINAPNNEDLRNYAAQAYYGYAYGFVEDENPQRAANFYKRGLNHALFNLQKSGLSHNILSGDLNTLQNKLKSFDKDELAPLFWAASNWAKWINLNRDKAEAIADLPKTVMLMQRVIDIDEGFYMAGPHIFFAVYYGSRSPLLGGDFDLSSQHFDKARKMNNNQLLIVDLLQAEYLDRQKFDQTSFHKRLSDIINNPSQSNPDILLINNIAKRKAKRLLEKESKWF
ncbi:MAG: TRAP transporter TatT component family protein [Gammaproteobacteria bacterium]|nr:TRAP transporter TatT component family protein [Gammaproteobacteria bacterium]